MATQQEVQAYVDSIKAAAEQHDPVKAKALPPGFWTTLVQDLIAFAGSIPQVMAFVSKILALFGIVLPVA